MTSITFQNVKYTEASVKDLSNSGLIDLYNDIVEEHDEFKLNLVNRFASKEVAQKRVWAILQRTAGEVQPISEVQKMQAADAHLVVVCKVLEATPTPVKQVVATGSVIACRVGSKQALMIDLLSRLEGASMYELTEALDWTVQSVKTGFSWDMKQKGYSVQTGKVGDIERFYLVVPAGQSIPPHYAKKAK